jgi:uncharacterized protein DUF4387
MTRLTDLAQVIRSKNAGPYFLTLDVLVDSPATFRRLTDSGVFTAANIARLYHRDPADVEVFQYPAALGIKMTFARAAVAGSLADTDLYGAQQHVPLYDLDIP